MTGTYEDTRPRGPLRGLRVVELASLAPGPFAAMMLSDLGAEVLRVDRLSGGAPVSALPAAGRPVDPLGRGRRSVAIDLKHPEGVAAVLRLVESADVLIEGFRPGVCERLGVGPAECLARNPRLVFARFTGWGQDGPLAHTAGHDIDYLALSGALEPIGPADAPPVPPINYVGDYAGGGMLGVVGIVSALWERERSGRGQVVDAAMVEGAALLSAHLHGLRALGAWDGARGRNLLDGGAPFYRTYACADGRFIAVGALEERFYAEL
ncbi:MAG TPA: CaiB/BaiF CoA-transferase family protein, partial [Actinopolymorphaceae bacterium]|nr:CaiB/BaiF CoA-transferase family protein [Actinopolymorphaceae bacterium]